MNDYNKLEQPRKKREVILVGLPESVISEIEQLRAENAMLRGLLESVKEFDDCPWCDNLADWSDDGETLLIVHEPDCKYMLAMGFAEAQS